MNALVWALAALGAVSFYLTPRMKTTVEGSTKLSRLARDAIVGDVVSASAPLPLGGEGLYTVRVTSATPSTVTGEIIEVDGQPASGTRTFSREQLRGIIQMVE